MAALTPPEHEHNAAIEQAAEWLLGRRERSGRATVPELRERFGLTAIEACHAIREAHNRKGGAHADAS